MEYLTECTACRERFINTELLEECEDCGGSLETLQAHAIDDEPVLCIPCWGMRVGPEVERTMRGSIREVPHLCNSDACGCGCNIA